MKAYISEKNEILWVIPEMTDSLMVSNFLNNNDFVKIYEKELITHDEYDEILKKYENFIMVSHIMNPYDRVYRIFIEKLTNFVTITKDKHDLIPIFFEKWINSVFLDEKLRISVVKHIYSDNITMEAYPEIERWTFTERFPNFFIKKENLNEDFTSVIREILPNSVKLSHIYNENVSLSDLVPFYNVYNHEMAKKVFHFYKSHFYKLNYDPFSFSNNDLNDEMKINFIHKFIN